jgi:hypothetical protein
MPQDLRRRKKSRKAWFVLGFLCLGVLVFHKPLVLLGCKAALHRLFPHGLSYEKIDWEEGTIAISGLQVKEPDSQLSIDRIELKLAGAFPKFQPNITVSHPQILISSATEKHSLPFLYRSRFIEPRWEIKNGVLQLAAGGRFYFSMAPGVENESIGHLVFSYDPSPLVPPVFTADLALVEKSLIVGFKLQESDLNRLLPLSGLLVQKMPREWEHAGGEVELEGLLYLDESMHFKELHCRGGGKQITFSDSSMGIDLCCDEIQGVFSYPIEEVSLELKSGNFFVRAPILPEELRIEDLNGTLRLEPEKEPELVLKGVLFLKDQKMAFDCQGKGGAQEDTTFWSEIALNCAPDMQSVISVCSHSDGDISLHLQVENANGKQLDFLRSWARIPGQCLDADAAFAATLLYKDDNWQQLSLDSCHLDHLHWLLAEQKTTLFLQQITGNCALSKTDGKNWDLRDLHLEGEGGRYSSPYFNLDSLSANIHVENSILQPSQITGKNGGLEGELAFLGPQGESFAAIKVQGDGKSLARGVFPELEKLDSVPVDLELRVNKNADSAILFGKGTLFNEPVNGKAVFSCSNGNFPSFFFKEADFQADLTVGSYRLWLPMLLPGMDVGGRLHCAAVINSENVAIEVFGKEISIQYPQARLELGDKTIHFVYAIAKKQWSGQIPLDGGKLTYRELDLPFENLEGSLHLEANHLTAPSFYAECKGLALRGKMDFSLEGGEIAVSTSQMAGSVENLFSVLAHFPSLHKLEYPMDGEFSSGDNGLELKTSMGRAEWSFKAHFDHLKFPINASTSVTGGRCDLFYDSKNQHLALEKGEGVWRLLDGTPLTLQLKHFSTEIGENPHLDFAFKIFDRKKEFAHFEGEATHNSISFNKDATFFGGTQLNITLCELDEQMKLASFEMRPVLKCQELHLNAAFLQNAGFLSKNFSPKNLEEWQFEGTLHTRLYSESVEKGFSFQAESSDLKVRGSPWPSFELKAHKIGENWLIEHLEGGGLTLKGAFIVDGEEVSVQKIEGKWQGVEWKGAGQFNMDRKQFSCRFEWIRGEMVALAKIDPSLKGNFAAGVVMTGDYSQVPCILSGEANLFVDLQAPLSLSARNKKSTLFTYNTIDGLLCQGMELQLKDKGSGAGLGEIKAQRVVLPKQGNLKIEQLQFSLAPAMMARCIDAKLVPPLLKELSWEGNLEGNGECTLNGMFQTSLKPGRYGFGGKEIPFEQLQLRYEKNALSLRGKTVISESPLWAALQVDLSKEPFGALKLYDHPKAEGLKISFTTNNGKPILEKIQGSCYGIDSALEKNERRKAPLASILSGTIAVDGNLLPKKMKERAQWLKIGNGYRWEGDLILYQDRKRGFQAIGTLWGHAFELLGYQFRNLQANLEATPERIQFTELKIDDPSGVIGIKKMELTKKEKWHLTIPHILVRNLHPSLMHKMSDDSKAVVKPFKIQNFTLSNVQCDLGEISTLEGFGKLAFVNQFKKESSIFDVPMEMIKKIGLDPGILTPVQGELEVELHGNKLYLMTLQNSFSEGGRAEFYLAPSKHLSYIDLDGKIHIDLKMHQEVMLKITEPFTLTIRGSLEKPRYGLQY